MEQKFLDYEHLQYYHQKLKVEFDNAVLSNDEIENKTSNVFLEYRDKTYYVSGNNFFRIKLASMDNSSGYHVCIPVEWQTTDLTLSPNSEYAFANAFSSCGSNSFHYVYRVTRTILNEVDGIAIELLCTDSSNRLHYFSTIGNDRQNFAASPHKGWGIAWDNPEAYEYDWLYDDWNFVQFNIPVGSSMTYHLNYYSNAYDYNTESPVDRSAGKFVSSNEFNITIIHSVYGSYSVIIK